MEGEAHPWAAAGGGFRPAVQPRNTEGRATAKGYALWTSLSRPRVGSARRLPRGTARSCTQDGVGAALGRPGPPCRPPNQARPSVPTDPPARSSPIRPHKPSRPPHNSPRAIRPSALPGPRAGSEAAVACDDVIWAARPRLAAAASPDRGRTGARAGRGRAETTPPAELVASRDLAPPPAL